MATRMETPQVAQADATEQIHHNTPSVSIQPVPEFSPDAQFGASLATRWKVWLADFKMFILASGIPDEKHYSSIKPDQEYEKLFASCQRQEPTQTTKSRRTRNTSNHKKIAVKDFDNPSKSRTRH